MMSQAGWHAPLCPKIFRYDQTPYIALKNDSIPMLSLVQLTWEITSQMKGEISHRRIAACCHMLAGVLHCVTKILQ